MITVMELSLSNITLVRLDVLLHSLKSVVASNQRIAHKSAALLRYLSEKTQTQLLG